jgi:polyphosphate kinase
MHEIEKYYDRELSWLSFNKLVLKQTTDLSLPLFERIKFLAIYSSNLDEFYKIRVASYRSLLEISQNTIKNSDLNPELILNNIKKEIVSMQEDYENTFYNQILPELEEAGIIIYQNQKLGEIHTTFIKEYFYKEVLPEIQPVLLSDSGEVLSFLQDNVIYLAIKMYKKKDEKSERPYYAVIKIPTRNIQRFIQLPKLDHKYFVFFLEDIIRLNLHILFPGYTIKASFSIKVSRNADLQIEDEFSGNILDKLKKSLKQRKTGFPARFQYDSETPEDLLEVLKMAFNISENDFVKGGKHLNFNDFFDFPNPFSPKYELKPIKQLNHPILDKYDSILQAVNKNEILLHFPYHTYDYVLRFFNEAALDPKVEEIKTTQYRLATNSAIVNALITAARNGKKVTVFVEVKARFDEETNIKFANLMIEAGINVISSIPGLKVHAKAALVIKKSNSKKNSKKTFAFMSTGNFNEKTAKQYSDEGFFTSDKKIVKDIEKLFNYLENPLENFNFKNILVPRFNFTSTLKKKIQKEITNKKNGKEAYIIFKMNSLEERNIIDSLYEAGQNDVKIDLIIRGICCLRPHMKFSPNIEVTRIVDRFLEHSRIFAFYNSGDWEVYISSADLMNRNLHRRVEIAVPIFNREIKKEIIDILTIQLQDNTKAVFLDKNIKNIPKKTAENNTKNRAQIDTYLFLEKKYMMEN